MAKSDLPTPAHAKNMRLIGHRDQGGKPDGCQIIVHRGYAYIGHMFSQGISVVDVRDPSAPKHVKFIAAPSNTWSMHLQVHDDLLLVINGKDLFAQPELANERNYYKAKGGFQSQARSEGARNWSAGLVVFDISAPTSPRQIGFLPVNGGGFHRVWYTGGRWAYGSALIEGFSDFILVTIDMSDPTKPREAGRYWLPGMNLAMGEQPNWPSPAGRYGLHHAVVAGDIAYCGWRDAGLAVVDVSDQSAPKLIAHRNWSPPYGGGTHTALPLPDRDLLVVADEAVLDNQEDGLKLTWVFDNRLPSNPVAISTLPTPNDRDYVAVGGHFGPHNLHENRPDSFVSSELIFATYQNAGVRVFDIRDAYRPVEVGAMVPPPPEKMIDSRPGRPRVLHAADVFVDKGGVVFATDFNAGLYIMEFRG